jgi:beta-N-acetylhexosaminidase
MTSHASYPKIWGDIPGTLSPFLIKNLLRGKFGFNGVVITDDLGMGAILESLDIGEATLKAFEAGADILLICHHPEAQLEGYEAIVKAFRDGRIKEQDIKERLLRIEALKKWHTSRKPQDKGIETLVREHTSIVKRISRDAITLVKSGGILPLKPKKRERIGVFYPELKILSQVEEKKGGFRPFFDRLRQYHKESLCFEFSLDPKSENTQHLLKEARKVDFILVLTINAHLHPNQTKLVKELLAKSNRSVVVAVRNPYDLSLFREANALVATYSFRPYSLEGVVDLLFGKLSPKGRLPVKLC